MKELSKGLKQEILCSAGGLENCYLDNKDEPPITLEDAIKYVYDDVIGIIEDNGRGGFGNGVNKNDKFSGKENIINYIKKVLTEECDYIVWKEVK